MGLRWAFDYKQFMSIVCFAIFTFCMLRYFEPADATNLQIDNILSIPSINLRSDVATVSLQNGKIPTPDYLVGSYSRYSDKTLLVGHSTTSFSNLDEIQLGDKIFLGDKTYIVYRVQLSAKETINMKEILASEEQDTVILMTCAGDLFGNGDATHRLLVYAAIEG